MFGEGGSCGLFKVVFVGWIGDSGWLVNKVFDSELRWYFMVDKDDISLLICVVFQGWLRWYLKID